MKMKKHVYFIIFLVCVSVFFHLFNTQHLAIGADTYHFLTNSITHENSGMLMYDLGNMLGEQGLVIASFLIGLLAVICLYFLAYLFCKDERSAFFSVFLIILFKWFFFRSQWYYVDKDMISLLYITIFFIAYLSKSYRQFIGKWYHRLTMFLLIIGFVYFWEAWYTLGIIWVVMELLDTIKHQEKDWYVILFSGLWLYTFFNFQKLVNVAWYNLFSPDKGLIIELRSPLLLPFHFEYLLVAAVIIYFFVSIKRIKCSTWEYKRAWILFWLIFALYMFSYRFMIYLIPVLCMFFAVSWHFFRLNHKAPMRYLFALFLITIAVLSALQVTMIPRSPIIELDINELCLISTWDQGHYWEYVLRKNNNTAEVLYKGNGRLYKEQIAAYVYGYYNTSCRLIYNNDTVHDIEMFLKFEGIDINQSDWYIMG